MNKKALLEWYAEAGVDEATCDVPVNRLAESTKTLPKEIVSSTPEQTSNPPQSSAPTSVLSANPAPSSAMQSARQLADRCNSLDELRETVFAFEGCALKKTASKTVFSDGNPHAKIMLIGEAPGAQEDIQGIPFCGPSGALLDKVLASVGLTRDSVYITNTVFWRPPGNRQPSKEETGICLPFVEKHIALLSPNLIILSGGTAASTLLSDDVSISRLRGKFYDYRNGYTPSAIQTLVTYHPSYLLRTPAQKKATWQDMLLVKKWLEKQQSTS